MKTKGIIEEDVKMYMDFAMKQEFNTFLGNYDVEFIGEKARVYQNSVFSSQRQRSRLNKVHRCGAILNGGDNEYYYSMTVNGQKVFFKSKHNIYEHSK